MQPTMNLRFVKRRVGRNVVRILQQQFSIDKSPWEIWRDVPMDKEGEATIREFVDDP